MYTFFKDPFVCYIGYNEQDNKYFYYNTSYEMADHSEFILDFILFIIPGSFIYQYFSSIIFFQHESHLWINTIKNQIAFIMC
jgi:hypothetical protein